MEPSMDDLTTSIWLFCSAIMLTLCEVLTGYVGCFRRVRSTYDEFDGIAKSGIQETTQGLTQPDRDLLGCKRKNSGEWNDGEEIEGKDNSGAPFKNTGNDAERHKDKQDVDVVCCDNSKYCSTWDEGLGEASLRTAE